jgi:hypothetical protein
MFVCVPSWCVVNVSQVMENVLRNSAKFYIYKVLLMLIDLPANRSV